MGNKQSKYSVSNNANRNTVSVMSLPEDSIDLQSLDLTGGYEQKVIEIPDSSDNQSFELEERWSHKIDFILASLGYSVGFGNLWRFPYKMYEHGGFPFLITYFFFLVVLGLPLFFIELVLGQYVGNGPTKIYGAMAPIFTGLGFSMIAVTFCFSIYYNVINSWCIYYLFASLFNGLPKNPVHAEDYFFNNVTHMEENTTWDNFGSIHWQLVLCSLAAWLIIAVVSSRSLLHSSWILKFNTMYPALVLITLCIIGLCQKGGTYWVDQLIDPDLSHFQNTKEEAIWNLLKDAAVQVIFSLGIGIGNLANLARYNDFKNNCFRDAMMVIIGDTFASIIAGITIFAYLGIIKTDDNIPIKDLVKEGPVVTFAAMMTGLNKISDLDYIPQLLTAMFSVLLLTIGINSMCANFLGIQYAILDQCKALRRHKTKLACGLCALFFLLSLPYCYSGGFYLFLAMENSALSNNAIFIALLQLILVGWVYGVDKFLDCVAKMGIQIRSATKWYFRVCIRYACPVILSLLIINALVNHFNNYQYVEFKFESEIDHTNEFNNTKCDNKYDPQDKDLVIGYKCTYQLKEAEPLIWLVQAFTLSFVFVMGIWKVWKSRSFKSLFKPTAQWAPTDEIASAPF